MKLLALLIVAYFASAHAAATLKVTNGGTDSTFPFTFTSASGTATQIAASAGTSTAITDGATYTARWTGGLPATSVYDVAQDAAGTSIKIVLSLGPQVAVAVTKGTAANAATGAAALKASAAAVTSSGACGDYYLDCSTGTLTFIIIWGSSATCAVQVAQTASVVGYLIYPNGQLTAAAADAAVPTTLKTITSAGANAVLCGAPTTGANNAQWFYIAFGSSAAATTAQGLLATAITAKTQLQGTNYATLLGGFSLALPTSTTAGLIPLGTTYAPITFTLSALTDTNSPLTLGSSSVAQGASQIVFGTGASMASKFAAGVPLASTITYTSGELTAQQTIVTLSLGTQVSLTITSCATSTASTTVCVPSASATMQTSQLTSSSTCGQYYLDCAAGTLQLAFQTPASTASNNQYCAYTITQVPAVFGGIQYASAPSTAAQTAIKSAITTQSGASGASMICGSTTSGSSTVLFFVQQLAASASASDVTVAQNKLAAALKAKTAFSGSARLLESDSRLLQTAYTATGGYANALNPSNNAGTSTVPSASATTNIAANASSGTKILATMASIVSFTAIAFGIMM